MRLLTVIDYNPVVTLLSTVVNQTSFIQKPMSLRIICSLENTDCIW